MGFDGCLLFLPKFLKLFKGLLIILPELPQIPFVPNFLCKESQLGKKPNLLWNFRFLGMTFFRWQKHNGASSSNEISADQWIVINKAMGAKAWLYAS